MFDELESEESSNDCGEGLDSESSLSQEINELGASLVSIGNEITSLSVDKLNEIREASFLSQSSCKGSNKGLRCWTHCRTSMKYDLQAQELIELRNATELLFQGFNQSDSLTVELIYENHILERGIIAMIQLLF